MAEETAARPVALVVGAGDATGGAIARRFARGGYAVWPCPRATPRGWPSCSRPAKMSCSMPQWRSSSWRSAPACARSLNVFFSSSEKASPSSVRGALLWRLLTLTEPLPIFTRATLPMTTSSATAPSLN